MGKATQNTCISPTSAVRQVCEATSDISGEVEMRSVSTCHCCFFSITVLVVSILVSGVLSAIATAVVASIIMWCVMKKRYKHPQSTSGRGMQDDKSGTHELTSVVYDVPVLKDQNQTISIQDNVAYGGNIPLRQNVAYEQHNYD